MARPTRWLDSPRGYALMGAVPKFGGGWYPSLARGRKEMFGYKIWIECALAPSSKISWTPAGLSRINSSRDIFGSR